MMKYIRRNARIVFSTCVQIAAITGIIVLGISASVADGSVTLDTQPESAQTDILLSGQVDSHANVTGDKPVKAGKPEETGKLDGVNHQLMKDRAVVSRQGLGQEGATSGVVKPVVKTFGMDVLIERLKKTDAIGMFTKLALRSDALDLMKMVKAYNKRMAKYSLQELRARFSGLMLKVLALLDDDPGLSKDINLAREDIWKSLLEVKA
ncbi:MAG: hypothetical protein Q9M24_00575 [Mariprofundaceae bacterium]|nr:hypothetical protein [Mariprofundaceae bacterium]